MRARFEALWKKCPAVGNVRGAGAMRALEFVTDRTSKEPAKDLVQTIARLSYERGLRVIPAGTYGNGIRKLMPLVITDEQLEEGLDVLEGAVLEASRHLRTATYLPSGSHSGGRGEGISR